MGQSPPGNTYNRAGRGLPLINGPTEFTDRSPIKIQWTTSPARTCEPGDLLICVRGSSTGRVNYADDVYAIGRGVAAIRAKDGNDTSYVSYRVIAAVAEILAAATGSTFPSVDGASFRKIPIPLPDPDEQVAISTALADVDRLIESLDALIAKKRAIKQATMQQLLTGKTRLPGFAKDWEPRPLATAGKCYRGVSYDPEHDLSPTDMDFTVRLLRSNNVQEAVIQLSDLQYVHSRRVSAQQLLRDGDLVLCMANGSRDLVGKAAHFESTDEYEYTFGAFMGCFRTDPVAADPRFVGYLLQTHEFRQYIGVILSGSSINNLKPSDVESAVFTMPCIDEQEAVATVLADMHEAIDALQRRRAKTLAMKHGMMQQLLTGRIRLIDQNGGQQAC